MEEYTIENLTFGYQAQGKAAVAGPAEERLVRAALSDINLTIGRGEFVTICGPSGCGKTTLLRHLKPGAAPHGSMRGKILFNGKDIGQISSKDAASKIGYVLQSPDNQIVTDKVWHELAFGLESLGVPKDEMRLRVAEMANYFGIQNWFYKDVSELSGGQKQLLALASIMAMQPNVLILDEPTSQLDPIAAGEFFATLFKINKDLGITIILTEHRVEEVLPISTRAVVMNKGKIWANDNPKNVGMQLENAGDAMFLAMPIPMRVWASTAKKGDAPITTNDGAKWLATQQIKNKIEHKKYTPGNEALEIRNVWFKYEKHLAPIVNKFCFKAHYGEIKAILGGNGAGKTTALGIIQGLYKPYKGKIIKNCSSYTLPQNPKVLFTAKTVKEDLEEAATGSFDNIIRLCQLEGLLNQHPYDLSGGEQQRVALAKVLLSMQAPSIILLDEPTKGLDAEFKQVFGGILQKLAKDGNCIVIVSHDIEFCAQYAHCCGLFFDGGIVSENRTDLFFNDNTFYTTAANRMARGIVDGAITVNNLVHALGGQETSTTKNDGNFQEVFLPDEPKPPVTYAALSKRTLAAAMIIFLTIPITIWSGIHILNDRSYGIISLLIIFQVMVPFALIFEGKKPRAGELITISVLCAIAVAGRSAFFMLPQFKPVVAIVIISAVAFGGEVGFLVGAMSALVSNMFFGQGPWTPWQMFAFGIIGFLAGVFSHKGIISRSSHILAIFGAIATFVIYGGIMNPASVIMWQPNPTAEMFIAAYIQGIPFDLVHALSTFIFVLIVSRQMLEKLDRLKTKYGL